MKRCAIYTRKSTNHRHSHDVNSLVTQREISSAYIASQRYRGWVEVEDRYDDGGHSGSGLVRPALAKLMQDIEAGKIDVVVVYKIDRLTRSLLDFVRLVEIFEQRAVGLVSISQAFDTSDSMGRMILNILLTFSQFERELIAERVKDSIRTRKKHGRVHGGLPPFGYVASKSGLQIEAKEAKIVRFIFAEFLRTERYTTVMTAVRKAEFCSSVKYSKNGNPRGGRLMTPGTVYNILRNPIYVGEIRGDDCTYPGIHDPIISQETWDAAQQISAERRRKPPHSKGTNHFLAGLLWDDLGRHMLLDLNWHRGRTYAAYASSNAAWSQREFKRAYRSNADRLDQLVCAAISEFFCDRGKLRGALKKLGVFGKELDKMAELGNSAAARFQTTPPAAMKALAAALLLRVEVAEESIAIVFRALELRRYLTWDDQSGFRGRPSEWSGSEAYYELSIPVRAIAAERWPSLNIMPRAKEASGKPKKQLVNLVENARKAQRLVEENRELSIDELSKRQGCRPTFFARLIRLNYLAPDIVTAIIDGVQPSELTRKQLLESNVPTDWALQRRLFGFPEPKRDITPRVLFGRGMWPVSPNRS
ncbi:MAG: recombinase family protein [Cyclobacteriaceae bacterium]